MKNESVQKIPPIKNRQIISRQKNNKTWFASSMLVYIKKQNTIQYFRHLLEAGVAFDCLLDLLRAPERGLGGELKMISL